MNFLIDFLGISFLWKVNRVGGLGKEIISKFGVNFYSLTDFTDFTDMEPWAALGGVTSCSRQHKNLCDPCNP